jgi:hypothetical protein
MQAPVSAVNMPAGTQRNKKSEDGWKRMCGKVTAVDVPLLLRSDIVQCEAFAQRRTAHWV